MDEPTNHDDNLMHELQAALAEHDAVPERVTAAARDAFAWRTIDADLAALTYDSLLDDKELAGVRSSGAAERLLTFESDDLAVELEVAGGRILGQLVPPRAGEVEIRHPGGSTVAISDALGRFSAEGIPRGPVSLRCRTGDATAIVTDWVVF